eukprot:gene9992-4899_t
MDGVDIGATEAVITDIGASVAGLVNGAAEGEDNGATDGDISEPEGGTDGRLRDSGVSSFTNARSPGVGLAESADPRRESYGELHVSDRVRLVAVSSLLGPDRASVPATCPVDRARLNSDWAPPP